jgi:hypothetical protein
MKSTLVVIGVLCLIAGQVSAVDAHPPVAHGAKKRCKKHKRRKCRAKPAPSTTAPGGPASPAKVTLTVARTDPAGGAVDSTPTGISCGTICSAQFDPGTQIQLTATPDSAYFQKDWSGAGCSGHGVCSFVITADTTVTADLVPKVTVDADVAAGSGSVDVGAPGAPYAVCFGSPSSSCTVLQGDHVTVTASPDPGSHFVGWSGDCSGSNLTFDFASVDRPDKACHATFASGP